MCKRFVLSFVWTLCACTDPFAGAWQAYGPQPVGDFEMLLESDLTGRVDLLYRRDDGTPVRVAQEVTAVRTDREDGVWFYDVDVPGSEDLECELERKTDELTCTAAGAELEFDVFEEQDANCKHSVCILGRPIDASCNACAAQVCELDKYCCNNAWDALCRSQAVADCPGTTCG